ncbi:alpha-mannosidase 2x-like [Saccostrea echinata]|uniref:alpha-mannosidase 2x-like n=1 Tax=Saccostrea echinata TaxID=191078 RepID=UPI002A8327F9|nr:alpha-mannosidase 2x-like [Saccostrea echinata]
MKRAWRRETLKILAVLTFVYIFIMFLMQVQLHIQQGNVDFLNEDQDHVNIFILPRPYNCYRGPMVSYDSQQTADFPLQASNSRTTENCSIPYNTADVEMEALWHTLDVSYPLALSVSGWLDVIRVHMWTTKRLKVIIMPHSHQDPGWLNTFDFYFASNANRTLSIIIDQLTRNNEWRFVWSEVCWLERWWESATQKQKDDIKRLIMNGQFEILSGGWVMSDEAVVHYSAMLNQLTEGHQWLLTNIGTLPNISWSVDPFGHSPTMAYLHRRSGIKAMVIQRIHFGIKRYLAKNQMLEFQWTQLWDRDSSTDIMTHVLPFLSYAISHSCGPDSHVCCKFDFGQKKCFQGRQKISSLEIDDSNVKEMAWLLWEQFQKKAELFRENVLLVPHGDDFRYSNLEEWEQQFGNLQKLMAYINGNSEMNTQVRFGTLSNFFEELGKSQTRPPPSFMGDFFPYSDRRDQYWTGFYTTRPFLKYAARRIQSLLRSVEILYAALLAKTRKVSEQYKTVLKLLPDLRRGRQELALFQHHDAITGTSRSSVTRNYKNRLQHAFNKLKTLFEKVTIFYLDSGFELAQNFNVSMIDDWDSIMTSKSRQKIICLSEKREIVIYNPLGHRRKELISLTVDRGHVKVTNSSTSLGIPHQISPVWVNGSFTTDFYELSFEVILPALSISFITIQQGEENLNDQTRLVLLKEPKNFSLGSRLPGIAVEVDKSPYITISNTYLTAYFYTCNGRLQYIKQNSTGFLWRSEVKFVTYTSGKAWSTLLKDKGGAYTFVPDGPAETFSEPLEALFLIDGPLFSRVVTVQASVIQSFTVHKTSGLMKRGVYIENYANIQSLDNTELMMRVESDIEGSKSELCVDLNGFQMHRKETLTKRGIQGNFYPMTTMASVENESSKLTLLTTSSRGVASLSPGWLEVGLDRRMLQDDWRGLGEGVTDNVLTRSSFMLIFERKSSNKISTACFPSSVVSQLSDELENPSIVAQTNSVFHVHPQPRVSLIKQPHVSLIKQPHVSLIKQSLPCNVHLINFRYTTSNTDDEKEITHSTKASYLLVVHKRQFDCNTASDSNICTNPEVFSSWDIFLDCSIKKAWETTLTGTVILQEIMEYQEVSFNPMEIKTFKVLCH